MFACDRVMVAYVDKSGNGGEKLQGFRKCNSLGDGVVARACRCQVGDVVVNFTGHKARASVAPPIPGQPEQPRGWR